MLNALLSQVRDDFRQSCRRLEFQDRDHDPLHVFGQLDLRSRKAGFGKTLRQRTPESRRIFAVGRGEDLVNHAFLMLGGEAVDFGPHLLQGLCRERRVPGADGRRKRGLEAGVMTRFVFERAGMSEHERSQIAV